MAGITTSEILAGEQPKNDDLGSRVDELTVQVDELRKEVALLRCRVTDKFEALEKKNNDE
jgi:outer membrane murein-binding lipoprotein Lpp